MNQSRRSILIALDASPQSLAALETAAKVASRLNAELRGVYVEDIDLLRTAQFPFSWAISSYGKPHALTPEMMEQLLRRQADKARTAIAAAGTHSNVAWSFSVVRGTVYREIERAASTVDLVTVGRSGWSGTTGPRLGSVTRSLLEAGAASLLMVGGSGVREPLAVLYDGSPAASRALTFALALDGKGTCPIRIILTGDSPVLRQKAIECLTDPGTNVQFEIRSEQDVCLGLRPPNTRTLLIPSTLLPRIADSTVLLEKDLSIFFVK